MANSRLCSISECGKPVRCKSYCYAHYERFRRHGDPLAGRTSRGELLRFIQEVALSHTGEQCLTWPFSRGSGGYGTIKIDGKFVAASRYVCKLSHGEPPTPRHEAAHSCGRGHHGCVAPGHLSWKTPAENCADRLAHGTHTRGERNASTKLKEVDVREIIALKGKMRQQDIAKRYSISIPTVGAIHQGKKWAWLS
jgi:hypothetical protein